MLHNLNPAVPMQFAANERHSATRNVRGHFQNAHDQYKYNEIFKFRSITTDRMGWTALFFPSPNFYGRGRVIGSPPRRDAAE